jgi:hypothetical protein
MWFDRSRTVLSPEATQSPVSESDACDFDVAYSEQNILKWMAYLPPDCIQCMIRMGWDIST